MGFPLCLEMSSACFAGTTNVDRGVSSKGGRQFINAVRDDERLVSYLHMWKKIDSQCVEQESLQTR
jgi:hypothetical protein